MASNWGYSWGSSWGNAWGVTASEDTQRDQILALLTSKKIYDNTTGLWRVYDTHNVEIADPSGILKIGLHGWLLHSNTYGATDTRLDQILALLTGRKVYDPATHLWRVYDSGGVEIADVGGVLQRGLHGWLLWTNAYGQFTAEITLAPAGNTRRNKVKAKVLAPVFAPTAKRWGVEEDEALLMACM